MLFAPKPNSDPHSKPITTKSHQTPDRPGTYERPNELKTSRTHQRPNKQSYGKTQGANKAPNRVQPLRPRTYGASRSTLLDDILTFGKGYPRRPPGAAACNKPTATEEHHKQNSGGQLRKTMTSTTQTQRSQRTPPETQQRPNNLQCYSMRHIMTRPAHQTPSVRRAHNSDAPHGPTPRRHLQKSIPIFLRQTRHNQCVDMCAEHSALQKDLFGTRTPTQQQDSRLQTSSSEEKPTSRPDQPCVALDIDKTAIRLAKFDLSERGTTDYRSSAPSVDATNTLTADLDAEEAGAAAAKLLDQLVTDQPASNSASTSSTITTLPPPVTAASAAAVPATTAAVTSPSVTAANEEPGEAERYLTECPICMEIFVQPRILPCHHTLCAACLQVVQQDDYVKCPLCQSHHEARDVKPDFRLEQFLDVLKEKEKKNSVAVKAG